MSSMKAKRPLLVTFIGDLSFIGALFVIISLFPTPKFLEQFISFSPISNFLDAAIRVLSAIILLLIFYGFLTLKKWGYSLVIGYNLSILALSIFCLSTKNNQLNLGSDFIPSLVALVIAFPSKKYFLKQEN